mmetsp:Transcript_106378/g.147315  ORF Transcript_106378/g.147315 Transcript_106378/m.147315 type:complete len:114 (+) Transcript_106378:138-479(+)
MVDLGFKVAIAEQTEDTDTMKDRVKKENAETGTKDSIKAVAREVANIYTKGTYFKMDDKDQTGMSDFDTKYILSYRQEGVRFGYCYFDMSTLKFYIGTFRDDFTLKSFRTLIM